MNILPVSALPVLLLSLSALAQEPQPGPFPGGPPVQAERKLLAQFDQNADERLDKAERAAAREFLKANPAPQRGGPRGPGPGGPRGGGPGGFGSREEETPVSPGKHISPGEVPASHSSDLYTQDSIRTLFLDFENQDWEAELEAFHGTDVEIPATLTADGKSYSGVGVHFRGMSSYMMVSAGRKRSLNLALDFTDPKQRINGYKTLNLLNSHGDGSFLSAVLYSHIARKHIPAPKVNLVRVVINGENWGVYVNQQQFNKDFLQENYRTSKGARWKVRGSPNGRGGLEYAGEDLAEYKQRYEMKSGDDEDWKSLVKLCKTLSETPADQLEAALKPLLDIERTLWFLALDCALINGDGYWVRASDYSLYRDREGKFHLIPGDMNEAFRPAGGGPPGFGGGRRGGRDQAPRDDTAQQAPREGQPPQQGNRKNGEGLKLDPLTGLDDAGKPLRSKLLAVPSLRSRYLAKVRTIAQEDLDWSKLGPVVEHYRKRAADEINADTRTLSRNGEFEKLTADQPAAEEGDTGRGHGAMPLRSFAEQRRAYLLSVTE
ncbi:CotH kinase family protein [Luteolibacter sp. GHJ8]|uniref:CotH kinase family protein n=1 Tax=Luteolibacter rhizosphaerae TaxID=2989719 RepID=A0ABT3GAB0_9BACT|nr:CotH kinase family protein [Luteolibacter rhizosphaerae]MCW1916773.1 CotH kinase family protein [Luteolibacter rhizosphaerae]